MEKRKEEKLCWKHYVNGNQIAWIKPIDLNGPSKYDVTPFSFYNQIQCPSCRFERRQIDKNTNGYFQAVAMLHSQNKPKSTS